MPELLQHLALAPAEWLDQKCAEGKSLCYFLAHEFKFDFTPEDVAASQYILSLIRWRYCELRLARNELIARQT